MRNTRSLVSLSLPPRYAQMFMVAPSEQEAELYRMHDTYLRWRRAAAQESREEAYIQGYTTHETPVQGELFLNEERSQRASAASCPE